MSSLNKAYKLHVRHPLKLFKPTSWWNFLTRFGCRTYTDHQAVLVQQNDGVFYIYEAIAQGVTRTNYFDWIFSTKAYEVEGEARPRKNRKYYIAEPIELTDQQLDKARSLCELMRGTPYDFENTLSIRR